MGYAEQRRAELLQQASTTNTAIPNTGTTTQGYAERRRAELTKQDESIVEKKPSLFQKTADISGKALQFGADITVNPIGRALERPFIEAVKGFQTIIPGGKTGKEDVKTPFGIITPRVFGEKQGISQSGFEILDIATAALPVERLVKKPLTVAAEKLYQSAAKFKDIKKAGKVVTKAKDLVKTGIKERVWLTKGGVERVASKIDDLESKIDDVIQAGKANGKIDVKVITDYVNDAKNFFENQANIPEAEKALRELKRIQTEFGKKYGPQMSIEKAQAIKVATGQSLKKYYDKMSSASVEGTKQLVRGLKEQIVEKAPKMGEINKRLKSLYELDKSLSTASGRISSLNLMGLPSKIGGATAGFTGAAAGKLLEIADSAMLKSGAAIGLDVLAGKGNKALQGIKVPLAGLIDKIYNETKKN